ncbi:MAG: hypothetical protein ACI9S8_001433, partial [Chlamydiales bacterium]
MGIHVFFFVVSMLGGKIMITSGTYYKRSFKN